MSKYLDKIKKFSTNNKLIHATPQFKKAISHIEKLEQKAWENWHKEACDWGATIKDASDYASERLEEI